MDLSRRRELCGADLDGGRRGVEIGPRSRPIVTRDDADVRYVDHLTTEELRRKYRDDPDVVAEDIVDVDVVWGREPLADALDERGALDFVVAAHVIEHVPDLIGWLQEVAELLRPGGVLDLFVPDKQFTLDHFRPCSTAGAVLTAHREQRRRPSFPQLFDHWYHSAVVDPAEAWTGPLEADTAARYRTIGEEGRLTIEGAYGLHETDTDDIDCHCWVFTPGSFVRILAVLAELGLLDFRVRRFVPTAPGDLEFHISLERLADDLAPAPRRNAILDSLPGADELRDPLTVRREEEIAELRARLRDRETRISAIESSRSWRLTRPIRVVVDRVRRR